MSKPLNNMVAVMAEYGYGIDSMMPAFPGKSVDYITDVQRDNNNALSRPVIGNGLLGVHPCKTSYFNISAQGFRLPGFEQPWPPRADRKTVFVFGGSTMVGYYIEDKDTIPAIMGKRLGDHGIDVYNMGGGNYTSRSDLLYFLLLIDQGIKPDIAVFLDGLNDCFYAFGNPTLIGLLDSLYQSEKRRRGLSYAAAVWDYAVSSFHERRRPLPNGANFSKAIETDMVRDLFSREGVERALAMSASKIPLRDIDPALQSVAADVWSRYLDTVEMIRGLTRRHEIETYFAWQPVPYFMTRPDQRIMERIYPAFSSIAMSSPVYNWLHAMDFPSLKTDPDFLDLSTLGNDLDGVSYVDICHYSPAMSTLIANRLADWLMQASSIRKDDRVSDWSAGADAPAPKIRELRN